MLNKQTVGRGGGALSGIILFACKVKALKEHGVKKGISLQG